MLVPVKPVTFARAFSFSHHNACRRHLNFSGPFSSIYSASKFRDLEGVERMCRRVVVSSESEALYE